MFIKTDQLVATSGRVFVGGTAEAGAADRRLYFHGLVSVWLDYASPSRNAPPAFVLELRRPWPLGQQMSPLIPLVAPARLPFLASVLLHGIQLLTPIVRMTGLAVGDSTGPSYRVQQDGIFIHQTTTYLTSNLCQTHWHGVSSFSTLSSPLWQLAAFYTSCL